MGLIAAVTAGVAAVGAAVVTAAKTAATKITNDTKSTASTTTTKKSTTSQSSSGGGGSSSPSPAPSATAASPVPAAPAYTPPAGDFITWSGGGGISFFVKPNAIQSVNNISIKATPDTEDEESDGEKYIKKKNAGSLEISMTAILNKWLGADVEGAARAILGAARKGESGYLYCAGKKLFTAQFMMTSASAEDILYTAGGIWVSCEVKMTFKQSSKFGGETSAAATSSGGGGGGGGGGSSGSSSGGSTTKTYTIQIPGMSQLKITATSPQAAVTKAMGTNWTGEVLIDGKSNQVTKGVITKAAADNTATTQAVTTTVNQTNAAKQQSQKVLENSKRTTTTNTSTSSTVSQVAEKLVSAGKNLLNKVTALIK